MKESAVKNSPLPPSVEKAYHQKCIELKRRIRGIEDANDVARQRVHRLDRSIMKMRVNRAFLMDRLAKLQELNDAESEISSSRPSSPHDHPSRSKSHHHVASPPAVRPASPPGPAEAFSHSQSQGYAPNPPNSNHSPSQPAQAGYQASPYTTSAHSQHEPLIHSLPNGTSVMLIAPGTPKPAPWHISELEPRHHVSPSFESWSLDDQEDYIFEAKYLPFDNTGNPVRVVYDPNIRKYVHLFPNQPRWTNPVDINVRTDAAEYRTRQPRPPPGPEEMTYTQRPRTIAEHSPGDTERNASGPPSGFTSANR